MSAFEKELAAGTFATHLDLGVIAPTDNYIPSKPQRSHEIAMRLGLTRFAGKEWHAFRRWCGCA